MTGPPRGWYDDPDKPGRQRWWDGTQWTEHRHGQAPETVGRFPGREQTSAGTVAGGFKFGCGFFLFIFVGLPVIFIGGCGLLAGAGSSGSDHHESKIESAPAVVASDSAFIASRVGPGATCSFKGTSTAGPDSWQFACVTRAGTAVSVDCFDPPPYSSFYSCSKD